MNGSAALAPVLAPPSPIAQYLARRFRLPAGDYRASSINWPADSALLVNLPRAPKAPGGAAAVPGLALALPAARPAPPAPLAPFPPLPATAQPAPALVPAYGFDHDLTLPTLCLLAPAPAPPPAAGDGPTSAITASVSEMKAGSPPPPPLPPASLDERGLERLLRQVNSFVNHRVRQQSDRAIYGRDEVWNPSGTGRDARGDCEDIALEKRLQLLDAGFPPERLFLGVVYSRRAGLHAVLVARLAEADIILDSRVDFLSRWSASGYQWLSVESPDDPMRWFAAA